MDRDRGVRSGTSSGPGGKARCGQFTGDTQLSLWSAKNAGHTGLKPIMQAVFSTSTWHAFAGHVNRPFPPLRPGTLLRGMSVIIDLEKSMLRQRGATGALDERGVEDWIKRGMRAQLQVESLLTGLLYIDLDLHKGTQPNFILQPGGPYQEIPTVPTDLAQLQQHLMETLDRFEKIDFKGLVNSITDAANSMKSLANSPDLKETIESLKGTVASLNQTMVAARAFINNANSQVGPLVADIRESSDEANKTMKDTRAALVGLQQTLDPSSPLIVHLNQTLDSLTETSQSLGEFTDYLQRNPAALIRGKYISDEGK